MPLSLFLKCMVDDRVWIAVRGVDRWMDAIMPTCYNKSAALELFEDLLKITNLYITKRCHTFTFKISYTNKIKKRLPGIS